MMKNHVIVTGAGAIESDGKVNLKALSAVVWLATLPMRWRVG